MSVSLPFQRNSIEKGTPDGMPLKNRLLRLPTAALSASGVRVEGHTFLSAYLISSPAFSITAILHLHPRKGKVFFRKSGHKNISENFSKNLLTIPH